LGPTVEHFELSCYGTIIFALEDIGVFRALPYIEMLLHASCQRKAMVRRVEVLWKRERPFRKSGEVDESFMGELTI
jgi:ferritin-like metal-binding protein YciE